MSLLLYGIARADEVAVLGTGLEQHPLRSAADGGLTAIFSEHGERPPRATEQTLREYGQIVNRLADALTMLPARFGSLLADEMAARKLLAERRNQFDAALREVAGAVELALRASWPAEDQSAQHKASRSGADYLHERLEQRRRARELTGMLDPLDAVARTTRQTFRDRPEPAITGAYLVDRQRVPEFVSLVAELDERLETVELVCTGPWPPYSFTEESR